MTPKEKAEEIWMKLFQKQIEVTGSGDGNLCVEIALIAVDEIIKLPNAIGINDLIEYWEQVKQEIEKL
jgi:hypothetical protein